jgi:hypothetical protein
VIRALLLALTALLFAFTIACGDDDDATPTPTPDNGLGASFPRHLTDVAPDNGASVTNADLAAENQGICASLTFADGEGMGDDPTSLVKLFVQGEDVTGSAGWQVTTSEPSTGGTICYVPQQDLEPGPILANVRWSDVTGREFTYSWQFTVTD